MWCDGGVLSCYGGNHCAINTSNKSTCFAPWVYIVLYVTYVSVNLDKNKIIKVTYCMTNAVLGSFAYYGFFLIHLKCFLEITIVLLILEMKHLMLREVKCFAKVTEQEHGREILGFWSNVLLTHSSLTTPHGLSAQFGVMTAGQSALICPCHSLSFPGLECPYPCFIHHYIKPCNRIVSLTVSLPYYPPSGFSIPCNILRIL